MGVLGSHRMTGKHKAGHQLEIHFDVKPEEVNEIRRTLDLSFQAELHYNASTLMFKKETIDINLEFS